MDILNTKVQYIKGVGPKRATMLKRLGLTNIYDILYNFPKEYDDRTTITSLRESIIGETTNLDIEIIGPGRTFRTRNNLSILKIPFKDDTGLGYLMWFNQNYLSSKIKIGEKYIVSGKLFKNAGELNIVNPELEKSDSNKAGRIVPIYAGTKGLSNNQMINIVKNALDSALKSVREVMPEKIRKKYGLIGIKEALYNIHFPKDENTLEASKNRLIFEELFILQVGLFSIKNRTWVDKKGIVFKINTDEDNFIESLNFNLTNAQKRVLKEINQDMDLSRQMNRLVQGDVGSGKTIIAAIALFRCIRSGYQGAMMAPTEILALQHFESINKLFSPWGIKTELLVGSLSEKQKSIIVNDLEKGKIQLVIGTHAIIQDKIKFNNLGLVITDEQHRFGVKQRSELGEKGVNPDVLVMTATPIPRTLALIIYGDLDISIIDELPPGRKEIETYSIRPDLIDRMNNFIGKNVDEGRQVYIVCPLIEESEKMNLNSAEEVYLELKKKVFSNYRLGLLHGKMTSKDKDDIINKFKKNEINILVTTTVIEVGVNVPNANIMVIYNAERFGLAQLHQLRGRVGRGEYQSYCILINYSNSSQAMDRMRILQKSSNGFIISEKDLEMRGPGEFFGSRQHGLPELKIANLLTDTKILKMVQEEAEKVINQEGYINNYEYNLIKQSTSYFFNKSDEKIILN